MHRAILQPLPGVLIDHIDGNGLNNQRANLRLATQKQNVRYAKAKSTNKVGYKGVSLDKVRQLFKATITVDGRQISLGRYLDPIEAARAYDQGARQHFGTFAFLNFPNVNIPPTPRKYLCPFCGHELPLTHYAPAIHVGHCPHCKTK